MLSGRDCDCVWQSTSFLLTIVRRDKELLNAVVIAGAVIAGALSVTR